MTTTDKLTDEALVHRAVLDWIKEDAPIGIKMQMTPDLANKLSDRIAHRRASQAAPANWQDDPAADDRWCAGNDFALSRLCAVLKVDPDLVDWDGSDNSLQDEADALILRILNAQAAPAPSDGLREAVDAAWNDAIEAAARVTLDRQGRRAMGDGHGNSSYDIGISDAANAVRALRRAAPTDGEA